MFIHKNKLNNCKCGSTKEPILDSDDFVPCWDVSCKDCGQRQHSDDWSKDGAIKQWNNENINDNV